MMHGQKNIKLWIFSTDFFLNILKYRISSKSVQWEVGCSVRTDRHDKFNSLFFFSQFRERALKLNKEALLEITRYKCQFHFSLTEQSTEH